MTNEERKEWMAELDAKYNTVMFIKSKDWKNYRNPRRELKREVKLSGRQWKKYHKKIQRTARGSAYVSK